MKTKFTHPVEALKQLANLSFAHDVKQIFPEISEEDESIVRDKITSINESINLLYLQYAQVFYFLASENGVLAYKGQQYILEKNPVDGLYKLVKSGDIPDISQQRELFYDFITWYNAKPEVKKPKDGLITTNIIEDYLKEIK